MLFRKFLVDASNDGERGRREAQQDRNQGPQDHQQRLGLRQRSHLRQSGRPGRLRHRLSSCSGTLHYQIIVLKSFLDNKNMPRGRDFMRTKSQSGGSETSNLPKFYPSNPKIYFLLHFHIIISKSQGGQLTPLTPYSRGPWV